MTCHGMDQPLETPWYGSVSLFFFHHIIASLAHIQAFHRLCLGRFWRCMTSMALLCTVQLARAVAAPRRTAKRWQWQELRFSPVFLSYSFCSKYVCCPMIALLFVHFKAHTRNFHLQMLSCTLYTSPFHACFRRLQQMAQL